MVPVPRLSRWPPCGKIEARRKPCDGLFFSTKNRATIQGTGQTDASGAISQEQPGLFHYLLTGTRLSCSEPRLGATETVRSGDRPRDGGCKRLKDFFLEGRTVDDILAYIDDQMEQTIERLQAFCRQPSIAAQGVGMEEMAALVKRGLEQVGAEAELVPTGGYPVVLGRLAGRGAKTLMLYNHYDVQPPEPLAPWNSPPFAAEIREGHLYARGVADNKGNLVARLAAVEAWLTVRGELPLTVLFAVEGEEEIGSPNLGRFAEENQEKLQADGCIWETGYKDTKGRLEIMLGAKGILAVDLRVRALGRDLHSANAAVAESAVWRLVWALNSLKGPDERIRIPGFYDDVRPPDERDRAMLAAWDLDESGQLAEFGAERFLLGLSGQALTEKFLFQPTCNVCGFHAGYGGPGIKTVLPAEAAAKLDFRLVPDQDPHDILEKLRAHLDAEGFDDVEIVVEGPEFPARTDPDDPLVGAVVNAARRVYGEEPVVKPIMAGTGPMYELCQRWGMPAVGAGIGWSGSRSHSPNENVRLEDLRQGIKHIAWILEEYSR
jgi:acetylornithine deacetylase/succinyl-diaminopimelate desuccinylase-like protein